uniref:KCND2 n=1 Tax=Poeciliopsis prolifica TaxID=188132 RepID=A0A0S7ETE4_9TELE
MGSHKRREREKANFLELSVTKAFVFFMETDSHGCEIFHKSRLPANASQGQLTLAVFLLSRSSLNAKLDETVPLKCDEAYISPSMVRLSAPVATSSGDASTATTTYSQSNIVRVSAL